MPYSLIVHAYSNLQFQATLQQDSLKPGAKVTLNASLKQYDVPFTADATVWAEITRPDKTTIDLKMARTGPGLYSGAFLTSSPGVYLCRIRAEGYADGKDKFTREKTLTAVVYYGDHSTTPGTGGDICDLLHCLTSEKLLSGRAAEKMRELGIDWKTLTACLEAHCPEPTRERKPAPSRADKPPQAQPRFEIRSEMPSRLIEKLKVEPMPIGGMAAQSPAFPRVVRMFSHAEEEAAGAADPVKMDAPATQPTAFPRIVRMFSREGEASVPVQDASPKKPIRE